MGTLIEICVPGVIVEAAGAGGGAPRPHPPREERRGRQRGRRTFLQHFFLTEVHQLTSSNYQGWGSYF